MSLLPADKDASDSLADGGPSSGSSGAMSGSSGAMSLDGGSFEPRASTLSTAGPHSGTTFDVIGSAGVAILVIVGATVAMDRLPRGTSTQQSRVPLLMFVLGATVSATIRSRFFRRGPLEHLLNAATEPAKHIR